MADNKVLLEFGANWDGVKRAAAGVKRSLKGIATTAKKTARVMYNAFARVGAMLKKLARNMMTWFKRALIGVGVGIIGAVKVAGDLEDAMLGVSKTTSYAGKDLETLRQKFLTMSLSIPRSAAELARIGEVAGQLGIRGVDDIAKFTEVIAKMTVAMRFTPEEAATTMGQLLNVFKMTVPEAENLASAINALQNTTKASGRDIAEASLQMGTVAKRFGLTNAEILAVAASMRDVGQEASVGATSIVQFLNQAMTKSEKFAKALSMSTGEYWSMIEKDAAGALKKILATIGKLDARKAAEFWKDIGMAGGKRAVPVQALASSFDVLKTNINTATGAIKDGKAINEEFAIGVKGLWQQFKLLWNHIKYVLDIIGTALIPTIKQAINDMKEWLKTDKVKEWAAAFAENVNKVINLMRLMFVDDNFYKSIKAAGEFILKAFGAIFKRVGSMLSAGLAAGMYEFRAKYMSDLADIFGLKNFVGKGMKRESEALRSKAAAALDEPTQGIGAELKDVWQNTIGKLNLSQSPVVAAVEAVKKEAAKTTKEQKKTNDLLSGKNPIAERTMSAFEQSVKEYQIKRLPKEQREKYLDKETSDADRASILEKYGKEPSKAMQRQLERKAFQASLFDKSREASQREQRERMGSLPNVSQKPAAVSGHTIQPVAPSMDTHMAEIKSNVESMIEKVAEIPEKISKATSSLANFMTAEESFTNKVYTTFQKVVQRLAKVEKRLASLKA